MSSINPSTRYSSFNSQSSSSSQQSHHHSSSSEFKNPKKPLLGSATKALIPFKDKDQNLSSMMKRLMDKRSNCSKYKEERGLVAWEGAKKVEGKASKLHRKLFPKGVERCGVKKVLCDVQENTRTLGMVLRSERELLSQNKEYEMEIMELKIIINEKNNQVDRLEDLCLKQREEIRALKSAILFPDVMNTQLQELFHKQGSKQKQAKQVIPTLQRQVTSLSGQLQCLAVDLAEVKAEKHATRAYNKGHVGSPTTPINHQQSADSLEYSSGNTVTIGSSDEMLLKDFNPCLTPFDAKEKSMEFDGILDYDSPQEEMLFESNKQECEENCLSSQDRRFSSRKHYCSCCSQVRRENLLP